MIDSSLGFLPSGSDFANRGMLQLIILSLLSLHLSQEFNSLPTVCIFTFIHWIHSFSFFLLLLVLSPNVWNKFQFVGFLPSMKEGDRIGVEVNVKSEDRKKRTVHIFINGIQQKIFFENVPASVMFGFLIMKKDESVEFVRIAELKESSVKAKRDSFGYDFEGMREL